MTRNDPQDVPTSTETPERVEVGSQDDRTSKTASEALRARALKAWETAYLDGATTTEAMQAALDVVLPRAVEILGQSLLAPVVDPDEFDRYEITAVHDYAWLTCPRPDCRAELRDHDDSQPLTLGDIMGMATGHEGDAHGGWKPIRCQMVDGPNGPLRVQAEGPLPDGFAEAITALAEAAAERQEGTYWERAVLERFATGGPVDLPTVRGQVAALLAEIPRRDRLDNREEITHG